LIKADWRARLHEYIGGTVRGIDGAPLQVGGVDDHVHMLLGLKATQCIADIIREIKKASTSWVRDEIGDRSFHWQDGYGAFTVSRSNLLKVADYIRTQEEHHRKRTFRDEYAAFLNHHGITYDERHLW
jgi:REP element-mobilizing transposase RayT